jgi:serine/threonine protein kinase
MEERQFGPYRLVQQLAVGGMAEIHLAKTHGIAGFEKYVALKMIHPNYSLDQQFIQMLIDEAKITVQLQHVNIAQTFDLGRVGETYYITMEYVDGADLYKLLRKSAELDKEIPISVGCYIGKEVASGLDYAHRKRDHAGRPLAIVHRDVSPQNVLISYAGEVKLVDFGIAKATSRARQTAVGVIKGKYYYMSPEQAWGESLDHRTDIFSSGILLYETLTGQMLYLEEDLHKLLEMVRRADIPPPSTIRKDIPAPLDRIVMKALAKRPEDRYQNAGDLASELERFLHNHAPVFTAAKVALWMAEVLGGAAAPTLLGVEQKERMKAEIKSDARRVTRDQLVLARSEFNDENSIIREAGESLGSGTDTGTNTSARAESAALDETSTFDAPLPDVDSLPEAPGRGPIPSRSPTEPTEPIPGSTLKPVRSRPPTSQPQESSRGSAPAARLARPPTAPPVMPLPASGEARSARPPTAPPASKRPPTARGADEETKPLVDAVHLASVAASMPKRPVAAPPGSAGDPEETPLATPAGRRRRGDDDDDAGGDETLISEPPGFSGVDPTEIGGVPPDMIAHLRSSGHADGDGFGGDETVVQQTHLPEEEHEAPTLLKAQPVRGPAAAWESAPALAASVPQPAVSELRPPRQSRRTPVGGVSAIDAPTMLEGNALASLLHPGAPGLPQVALSPPTALGGPPLAQPGPFPPGMHPQPQPAPGTPFPFPTSPGQPMPGPFTTRQIQSSLEVDEIPDKYKIRRQTQVNPIWIAAGALILAAVVAAVLIAIYGSNEEKAATGTAVIEVVSSPPGATVTVDGEALPNPTPTTFDGATGKTYLIRLDLAKHQRWEREHPVGEEGGNQRVVARLDPIVVRLWVESKPPGAEVFIGGTSAGRTPLDLSGLDPQTTRSIEVRLKGFRPVRRTLDWTQETEKRLIFELEP